jgi:heat shock protein HslJ
VLQSTIALAGLLYLGVIGCGPRSAAGGPPSSPGTAITGREWVLVALGERSSPVGAGGKPATIQFDSASSRASGFAGCNRFSGGYTLGPGTLSFGPLVSTKMACVDGDELERGFLAALPRVTTYAVADSTLTLGTADGPLLRFVAR